MQIVATIYLWHAYGFGAAQLIVVKINPSYPMHNGTSHRTVVGSENPGVPVLFGEHNLPPLVEIVLTDLPKSGGAPAPTRTTGLGLHSSPISQTNKWDRTFFLT